MYSARLDLCGPEVWFLRKEGGTVKSLAVVSSSLSLLSAVSLLRVPQCSHVWYLCISGVNLLGDLILLYKEVTSPFMFCYLIILKFVLSDINIAIQSSFGCFFLLLIYTYLGLK